MPSLPYKKNYEIKIPVTDLKKIRSIVKNLSVEFSLKQQKTEIQKDIYYKIKSGRLKLRIINDKSGELIYYNRKEKKKIRVSNYIISGTNDYKNLNGILSSLLPVLVIVEKKREIFVFNNIRIHLDNVKNLGEFLEFEIIYDNFTRAAGQMNYLIEYFKLDRRFFIKKSYSDLLIKIKQEGK